MRYNKTDYEILNYLMVNDFTDAFKSCTVKSMICELGYSESKIRNTINDFTKDKYVSEGMKLGQAKTYYITESGVIALKELILGE